ncbi:MAG: nicotinamide riboside transporter PnuC [Bacteroidota bacterium]
MYLKYIEIFSVCVSLGTIWLGIKQRPLSWLVSIFITLLNLSIYHEGALYDKWISGFMSIAFSIYGWYNWRHGGRNNSVLKTITKTSQSQFIYIVAAGIAFDYIVAQILLYCDSSLPYIGAISTLLVIIGLWMSANKKLEAYIVWSLLNIISIYVHYQKSYLWFTLKYLVYLLSSSYGYMEWRKLYLADRANTRA